MKPRLLGAKTNLEIAFSVARTINDETEKIQRFRTVSSTFAGMPIGKSTKFNQLRLIRLQC
jgi:hypothetical protein